LTTGLVVGASGGIGRACAVALAGAADVIVLSGRNRERLEAVAAELGGSAKVVAADVASATGRDAIFAAIDSSLAWAVLASGVPLRKPLAEATEEEVETTFATNVVGPTLLLRRLMQATWHERAAIVVIGSISASRSLPDRAVYGASKAGIEHLTRSLAAEMHAVGIRINVVAPGVIETEFLGEASEELADWVEERVPLARMGDPAEVASVVRYLVVEAPPYLTGARIVVDGGVEAVA